MLRCLVLVFADTHALNCIALLVGNRPGHPGRDACCVNLDECELCEKQTENELIAQAALTPLKPLDFLFADI